MSRPVPLSTSAKKWISMFVHSLAEHDDLTSKTILEYSSDISLFAHWFESTWNDHRDDAPCFSPDEITTPTIIHFREYMQKVRGLRPSTVNRRLNSIKRYFDWAVTSGNISIDCSKPVKLVAEERTSPRQMTDKEEATLLSVVERGGVLRDRALIVLMLHTGLRSMEVCNLIVNDITIGKRTGQVMVRSGKRNKQREVPLNSTVRFILETYLPSVKGTLGYLFPSERTGGRLSERALRHVISKYMRDAHLIGLSAHDLRHRFGYVMSERTPLHRLAQIMGHDSLDTTMIYVRATKADLQSEVEKISWR